MRPTMLVIDDDPADRCFAVQLFAAHGWQARGAGVDDWHRACTAMPPWLVIAALPSTHVAPDRIAALRAMPGVHDSAVVAWLPGGVSLAALSGYDDVLAKPAPPDALATLAKRWWPDDPPAALDRLGRVLGEREMAALTERLHDRLRAILASVPDAEPGHAHHIAGIAGMLGFDTLGAAWLAVSDGVSGAEPAARIATRRALSAFQRRCGVVRPVSCSGARP